MTTQLRRKPLTDAASRTKNAHFLTVALCASAVFVAVRFLDAPRIAIQAVSAYGPDAKYLPIIAYILILASAIRTILAVVPAAGALVFTRRGSIAGIYIASVSQAVAFAATVLLACLTVLFAVTTAFSGATEATFSQNAPYLCALAATVAYLTAESVCRMSAFKLLNDFARSLKRGEAPSKSRKGFGRLALSLGIVNALAAVAIAVSLSLGDASAVSSKVSEHIAVMLPDDILSALEIASFALTLIAAYTLSKNKN